MPVHNAEISAAFDEIADLLEIRGDNPFRIRAYRNAARLVGDHGRELRELVEAGEDLTTIPGIGKDLAAKIAEICGTGRLSFLDELRASLPAGITDLLRLPGLGPKRVKVLSEDLKIHTIEALEQAAKAGKIREIKGFGEKTEASLLKAIQSRADQGRRFRRAAIAATVESLVGVLRAVPGVERVEVAGSYRRARETVGDVDLLVVAVPSDAAMQAFVGYDEVQQVLAMGDTKSSVVLRNGLQADLRVVPAESFGAALQYFTGSKEHNVAVRKRAQQLGLKVNEYGVLRGEESVAGASEKDVYAALGLAWIPPEMRENRGEVERAEAHTLPRLLELGDIRGDLHNHSTWSDGAATIEQMAEAARAKGYEYVAITDHSKRLTVANGLDAARLRAQRKEIDAARKAVKGIGILHGVEVDILEDGTLDLDDGILGELDLVVASVHHKFNLSREEQTKRVLRAMDNPLVTFVAHPTGRLVLERDPYEIDVPALIAHAKATGCFLELNANPWRLDLNDVYCQMARDAGVLIAINSDGHSAQDLDFMRYGVGQARRGWLGPEHVLNTLGRKDLQARISSRRR